MTWRDRGDIPLVVGFGGGLNSSALLVMLHERGIVPDLITFADVGGVDTLSGRGGEKPETYAHVDRMQEWLAAHSMPPITVVRNVSPKAGYLSLEDNCLKMQMLPSRAYGFSSCADKWKIEPQNKYLRGWLKDRGFVGVRPWKLLGYDGGEQRRATIFEDDVCRYAYPLIEWDVDREMCESICNRAGLRCIPKSACFFCPSSTKAEVLRLSKTHPDLFARATEMEHNAADNLQTVKGLGRAWSWSQLVAADEAQLRLFPDAPVESCTMCRDESEDA